MLPSRNDVIIDLQEKIFTAQQVQSELLNRLNELEKSLASFEAWEAETQRYQLKDFGGNTLCL